MLRYLQKVVRERPTTAIPAEAPSGYGETRPSCPASRWPFITFPRPLLASIRRAIGHFWSVVRGRPKSALLLVFLALLAGTGGGLYFYADRQWHAAQRAVKEGRLDDAQANLTRCLFFWPRSVEVHLLAARADRLRGDLVGAEAHLNECLKLHHGPTEAIQLEFLLLRVQKGEEDEVALPLMAYVEKNDPETPVILETLSAAYMNRARYGAAYSYLCRWIDLRPEAAIPYYWRGWVVEQMNGAEDAMKDYERALELDPDLLPARLRLAEMWLERSDPPKALPHLERLSKQHPDRADVMARLGECRFLEGNLPEARRLLEAAREKLPDDPDLLLYLSKLDLQEGRPTEAERTLRQVLKIDPFATDAGFALVDSLRLQGRDQEAAAALEQFEKNKALLIRARDLLKKEAEHPTKDSQAPSEAGILLLRLGQDSKGIYWLREALRRDARHEPTLKALAEYYEDKGDVEQAAVYRSRLPKQDKKASSP